MSDKELIAEAKSRMRGDIHMPGRVFLTGVIDALEARQPTENDREALVRVVANHPIAPLMRLGGDAGYPLADAILAAGFSRAAVPDAATGELERAYDLIDMREFEIDNLHELISELRAEHDAALAALERVRAVCLHLGGVDGDVSQPAPSYYTSIGRNVVATEVLAALDGAPESEVKP